MKTNDGTRTRLATRVGGAGLTAVLACGALVLASGCEEEESVFERRYVLVAIPGFAIDDHVALLDHEDPNLRYLALANLLAEGALSEPEGDEETKEKPGELQAKLRELMEDPAPKVRAIASYAPINRSGPGAEGRLVARLEDPHDAVRVEALASLGADREERVELSPEATDRVVGLLDHDNVLVRLHALETLGGACNAERAGAVVGRITHALPKREIPEVLKALETLGRIDAAEADNVLLGRLDDDDERVVRVAARGLVGTKPAALEDWFLNSLGEAKWPEDFLITTLAEVATVRSREAVVSRLGHADGEIRAGCRRSLVRIGDREALDALAGALEAMMRSVEKSLALPSTEQAPEVEEFVAALGDISGLGEKLGTYQFNREGLEVLLQSSRQHEQLIAMARLRDEGFYDGTFLGDQGAGASFVGRLKTLAADRSPVMRVMACEALGRSLRADTGEVLLAGTADPVFGVRRHALDALIQYTSTTSRWGSLRAVYDRRDGFTPVTYAEDEAALILRERIEAAARRFEPSWVSVQRAQQELRKGPTEVVRLLAASHLVPREEAVEFLLEVLGKGSEGARTYALRTVSDHLQPSHLDRLRNIAAGETDPQRKQSLSKLIAGLEKSSE